MNSTSQIPLLSVTIPTYNRASVLERALASLIPQVRDFAAEIELVISDNCSTDSTGDVIQSCVAANPDLRIRVHLNLENEGFFGNAVRCRALARGKFMWLLSDDDFVAPETVDRILSVLRTESPAFIFLKSAPEGATVRILKTTALRCLHDHQYELGLISGVVFLNNRSRDAELLKRYHGSPFIGLIFLINAYPDSKDAVVIEGRSLLGANAPHSVRDLGAFFRIFVVGMESAIECMRRNGIPPETVFAFRRRYLAKFLLPHYLIKKAGHSKSQTPNTSFEFNEADRLIAGYYRDLAIYWLCFFPLSLLPGFLLSFLRKVKSYLR